MMQTAQLRFFAIAMASMLLVTSMGWSMSLHYCQGQLKGASLIGEAESCHKKKSACHHSPKWAKDQAEYPCCQNHTIQIKADDTDKQLVTATAKEDIAPTEVVIPARPIHQPILYLDRQILPQKYRPPPPLSDKLALLQVYRL